MWSLLSAFSAVNEFGRLFRQVLAQRCRDDLATVEADLVHEQQQVETIENRIARIDAEHNLRMQYLIHFGVTPEERHEFQRLLEESAVHGGLSPREVAALAHARYRLKTDQRNGSTTGPDSTSIERPSTAA